MKTVRGSIRKLILILVPALGWAAEQQDFDSRLSEIKNVVSRDYKNFYSLDNLAWLGAGLGAAALFSHTHADQGIRDWYQGSLRNCGTDDFSRVVKTFGDRKSAIPVYAGVALLGELAGDNRYLSYTGEWGKRSLRTLLAGGPPVLFLQESLGGNRPEEGDSHWHFFKNNHAVSGHSFLGAVPFLTAAMMVESPYLKIPLYLASTLTGLSRINDDAHYFSQAFLGWWLAYSAAASVEKSNVEKKLTLAPSYRLDGMAVAANIKF
ncbi:MAG TPA: phosphatase PAP2 family protein [archaeon]|nr:phosphatase PAP2 family protein [archaeon]